MSPDRDVAAFDERAASYESGWLGHLHHDIADHTAAVAESSVHDPKRILDVGCGTGYLLRRLGEAFPSAEVLCGVDPAARMISVAEANSADPRLRYAIGTAEHLPYDTASFDLVVSTTSFDHWHDQQAGLIECARVLMPGGRFVLCDQFSLLLLPTLLGSRSGKARTQQRATRLLMAAGFAQPDWHGPYSLLLRVASSTLDRYTVTVAGSPDSSG